MTDLLRDLAIWLPALFVSFTVHEYAHAWTATRLGDDTAAREGRLTLSPFSHLDPIGSFLFPIMLLVVSGGTSTFGWARPVPFQAQNFDRRVTMRQGAALTAVAGPLSNVGLAFLSLLTLAILLRVGVVAPPGFGGAGTQAQMAWEFLVAMFNLNVLLAVFNALPIPPLDGSHLLPRSLDDLKDTLARFGPFLIIGLFVIGPGHLILGPLQRTLGGMLQGLVGLLV